MKNPEFSRFVSCTAAIKAAYMRTAEMRRFVNQSLRRFCDEDFGNISDDDRQMNLMCIREHSGMVLAEYISDDVERVRIWITHSYADGHTTIIFPSEY